MRFRSLFGAAVFPALASVLPAQAPVTAPGTEQFTVKSRGNGVEYVVQVWLPPGLDTMTVRPAVFIVTDANRSNDNAPSHRVYVGRAEIGAAWSKRSEEGRDYLSLKLDDPSF